MKLPHRRQFLHLAAGAAALPAVSRVARAQAYPSRPITMIVPAPAGGPTDSITRILIEHMRSSLDQPIVIENGGGAGGTIAVGRAARANPDGYTLVVGNWGNFVVTGAIYSLAYDLQTAFEPISPGTREPFIVVARKTMAANNLRVGCLAEGKFRQGIDGHKRDRRPFAHLRGYLSAIDWHAWSVCALSRSSPRDAGFGSGSGRRNGCRRLCRLASEKGGHHQDLRRCSQQPP